MTKQGVVPALPYIIPKTGIKAPETGTCFHMEK